MPLRTVLLLVVAIAIAALAALNWGTLATPTLISLGIASVTAPLGLVMLALTALLAVFFVAYVLYLQSSVLLETRRHTREMTSQRELADRAEASRFTELRKYLDTARQSADTQALEVRNALLARIDSLERGLHTRIEQADNTTAAYLGQMEDRLDPHGGVRGAEVPRGTLPLV